LGEQQIGHNLPTRQQLRDFFSCIYRNRSIVALEIESICTDDKFAGRLIEGLCGLYRLEIGNHRGVGGVGTIGCKALGKVLKHPMSKLKNLRLNDSRLDDEGLSILCDGLLGNNTLKRLWLGNNEFITSVGWSALSTILQHPKCNLIELGLYFTQINDESAVILGTALVGCTSLRDLDLGFNESVSSTVWQALLNQLSQTSIQNLDISDNKINDTGLLVLANMSGTIKSLVLSSNNLITPEGWRSFFGLLQTRGAQLVKLDITDNYVGDLGAVALGRLVNSMGTLKTLQMAKSMVTSRGWASLFTSLQGSNLAELGLDNNNLSDEEMQLLVPLVSSMGSLKDLRLGYNQLVTPTGWHALSGFFQSPNCSLKELCLAGINLNDDTIVSFASALVHDNTLTCLFLGTCVDNEGNARITKRGWEAMSDLLCNKSSIMGTYTSNHILQELGHDHDYMDLPDDLISYLKLNENKDKVEVARQKILQAHFSTDDDDDASKIQELLDIELEMVPTVVEWIGRPTLDDWKGTNVSGLSSLYNLMRRLPDLFDSSPQKKSSMGKRKRGVCPN